MICSRVGLPSRRVMAAIIASCACRNGRAERTSRAQQLAQHVLKAPAVNWLTGTGGCWAWWRAQWSQVIAATGFDAAAQAAIDDGSSGGQVRLHMALIRPDVAMGELLKTQPGSQLFMVFSAPRVKAPERLSDGQWVLEVEGMDVYDPVSGALYPTSRERMAASRCSP